MRVMLSIAVLASALLIHPAAPAAAGECVWSEVSYFTNGQVVTELEMTCSATGSSSEATVPVSSTTPVGDAACAGAAAQFGLATEEFCAGAADQLLTIGAVARAFSEIPLPASELIVQPPNGRTLVNFATNFYTDTETFTRTITLLGQHVDLRITPATYDWRFGDGHTTSTTTPGAAYPDLQVTHDYLTTGTVTPAVDTTYTADFRVNNTTWRPVPGTVTIPGTTVPLEIVEATPTLVGYR